MVSLEDFGRGQERSEESSKCSHWSPHARSTVEILKPPRSVSKVSKKDPILPKVSPSQWFPHHPSPRTVLFPECFHEGISETTLHGRLVVMATFYNMSLPLVLTNSLFLPSSSFSKHFLGHTFHPALLPLSVLCFVSLTHCSCFFETMPMREDCSFLRSNTNTVRET